MIKDIATELKKKVLHQAKPFESWVGLVLGSGWNELITPMKKIASFPYTSFTGLPQVNVIGHQGLLTLAQWENQYLVIFQGRFHPYEGHPCEIVTFNVRILHELGIKKVILTNAAGGVNWNYPNGSIVAITDHINLMGVNPLVGTHNPQFGPRFPSMNDTYSSHLRNLYKQTCFQLNTPYFEGIYGGMLGPSYETPAEIRMLRILGADLVGMSTIPEAIFANACGMQTLALSCVSNKAAHLNQGTLEHDSVKAQVETSMEQFSRVILETIKKV